MSRYSRTSAIFPSRPITIVVPFGAGSGSDIAARFYARALKEKLNATAVVDLKPGAAGMIAGQLVARAAPDGYTVLMALSSLVVLPEADKILNRPQMFRVDQLKPIARFTDDPSSVTVRVVVLPATSVAVKV